MKVMEGYPKQLTDLIAATDPDLVAEHGMWTRTVTGDVITYSRAGSELQRLELIAPGNCLLSWAGTFMAAPVANETRSVQQ
jgi:hypothetical protein